MHGLTTSLFSHLLLALFALQSVAFVVQTPHTSRQRLRLRQSTITCAEYSTLANLTAIGTNSTFRAAFIRASPDGTLQSETILNNAADEFDNLQLINDTALNKGCGNLTAIAIAGAASNFTSGIVGPFSISLGVRLGSGGLSAAVTAAVVGAAVLLLL